MWRTALILVMLTAAVAAALTQNARVDPFQRSNSPAVLSDRNDPPLGPWISQPCRTISWLPPNEICSAEADEAG